ncbi:hypothetical protein LSAT2_001675 [Lamellibrachia satsuma]|nr:hypothetical protein LSAT2_001675 [Lamellibrachia satsuma]
MSSHKYGRGGSSSTSKREQIAWEAESKRGSTVWAFAAWHKTFYNTTKCNIFVAEMIEAAGATVHHRRSNWWTPIGAREWAKTDSSYLVNSGCWSHVNFSSRGDVAACEGHMAIVTGYHTTTSATHDNVVTNDWGFRSGQTPTFWRYTC